MSTIVYQELQPCNESIVVESMRLSLKLNNPPKQNTCGWGDIDVLPRIGESAEKEHPVYVHPLVKRSASKLSDKSLEMCTESLGCETGTCIMESSIDLFPPIATEGRKSRPKSEMRKEVNHVVNFPPPLTTISGTNSIRVRPYREDGRLVIKAVSAYPEVSYLQAERSDGRLKLSIIVTDRCSDIDFSSDDEENSLDCDAPENIENEYRERKVIVGNVGKEMSKEIEGDAYLGEEVNESIKLGLGVKMELGKIKRPSRCKEGSRRLINWEPFWVTT